MNFKVVIIVFVCVFTIILRPLNACAVEDVVIDVSSNVSEENIVNAENTESTESTESTENTVNIPSEDVTENTEDSNIENVIDEKIEDNKEQLGITSFINDSKEYTKDFFDDADIDDIFSSAVKGKVDNSSIFKKILSKFGLEMSSELKSIIGILIIIVIHSILKAISDGLENDNISRLIYYVQYIAIVSIIMNNFSSTINLVKEVTSNLTLFMGNLIPILILLMIYTGNITTASTLEPVILFMVSFVGNIIQNVIIPLTLIATSICIISKISDQIQIKKLSKFIRSGTVWILGIILTVFVGVVSLEGSLSNSVDNVTGKTAKAIVSSAVPVVGKILGDAVDTVLGSGIILKNAVGVVGVIIVIAICAIPIIKVLVLTLYYKLMAGVCEVIADERIVSLLDDIGDIFKILLAILFSISFMVIIGLAVFIKIY